MSVPTGKNSVPELPAGNLLVNPWFRSDADPTKAGLDHWTVDSGWTTSQKSNQPSPDDVTPTASKVGPVQFNGTGLPDTDYFMYQDVVADDSLVNAEFHLYTIAIRPNISEVKVFGWNGSEWIDVWTPYTKTSSTDQWEETSVSTVLSQGYSQYRVRFQANFPTQSIGMKYNGVYFRVY